MRDWTDLGTDGRRLNRIIRILERKLKNTDDDNMIIRYSNSIGFLTLRKLELAKIHLGIKEVLENRMCVK